jgi:hypothetical protein
LNGEENIVLTGNDPPFAPLVVLKNFSLSELKDAINGGTIIGEGSAFKVYKVLNMLVGIQKLSTIMSPSRESLNYICTT